MNEILFYIVILVCNVIHGITGFAGTVLAMPPSLMLVGYDVAKPILNVLAILAGFYVVVSQYKQINWKELRKIVIYMAVGIIGGGFLKSFFDGHEKLMYIGLGIFIIVISVRGFYGLYRPKVEETEKKQNPIVTGIMLVFAGVVHGLFVSGGPLLIGYLSNVIKDKVSFRATISTIWIVLNGIILLQDVQAGLWTPSVITMQIISVPFLIVGMIYGTKLYAKMSQVFFMKLTYILLFISGLSLIVK